MKILLETIPEEPVPNPEPEIQPETNPEPDFPDTDNVPPDERG